MGRRTILTRIPRINQRHAAPGTFSLARRVLNPVDATLRPRCFWPHGDFSAILGCSSLRRQSIHRGCPVVGKSYERCPGTDSLRAHGLSPVYARLFAPTTPLLLPRGRCNRFSLRSPLRRCWGWSRASPSGVIAKCFTPFDNEWHCLTRNP